MGASSICSVHAVCELPAPQAADPGPPSHVRHAHLSAREVTGRRAAGHRGLEGRLCSACSGGAQRMRTSHAWGEGRSKQAGLTWTRMLGTRQELPKMDSEHTGSSTGSQWSLWALPLLRNPTKCKNQLSGSHKVLQMAMPPPPSQPQPCSEKRKPFPSS